MHCVTHVKEPLTITQAVIFVNTQRKADWLIEKINAQDFTVSAMQGDVDRGVILRDFCSGSSRGTDAQWVFFFFLFFSIFLSFPFLSFLPSFLLFFLSFFSLSLFLLSLFISRERGGEKERERNISVREKHQLVASLHMP